MSLELSSVYGFSGINRRNTIKYVWKDESELQYVTHISRVLVVEMMKVSSRFYF
jgi:hypothetical protein